MPCPFGFKGEDDDDNENEGSVEEAGEEAQEGEGVEGTTTKAKKKGADKEADPVSWFYKNQIKADKATLAKKKQKQQEDKQRLESIMALKNKQLEFEGDFDADAVSMASSELSELDSAVHSLRSLKSCAESWIEDAGYKLPAEAWVKFAAPSALLAVGFALFQAYDVHSLSSRVSGQCKHTLWPYACAAVALGLFACAAPLYYSTTKRSKRVLLMTQVGLLVVYTASAALVAYMYAHPTALDPKAVEATCPQPGKSKGQDSESPLCKLTLATGHELAQSFPWFLAGCIVIAISSLALASLGVWYLFELAYIEKKAAMFMNRHRHHRHRIPWHKIKIVGPVMQCGQGGGGAGGKMGGKCPVMH